MSWKAPSKVPSKEALGTEVPFGPALDCCWSGRARPQIDPLFFCNGSLWARKKGPMGPFFSNRGALLEALDALVAALGADREFLAAFAAA